MKRILFFTIVVFLSGTACNGQMMCTLNEANKLQLHKKQFIGKSFKVLLDQIKPAIKFVYGNPENRGEGIVGTNMKIFFVDKEMFFKNKRESKEPIGILISFQIDPDNSKQLIPIGGVNTSSKELLNLYGNMIIKNIYVTGSI